MKMIDLPVPHKKTDETEISKVELRKPNAGNLRGLKLSGVVEMEFDTLFTLLPRISDLNERDVLNLEPANMTKLATEVACFFVTIPDSSI